MKEQINTTDKLMEHFKNFLETTLVVMEKQQQIGMLDDDFSEGLLLTCANELTTFTNLFDELRGDN